MKNNKNKEIFNSWNEDKKYIQEKNRPIYFREAEIWWCKLGINLGDEQDGKGNNFSRPILIIKKFNQFIFLAVPLSTKIKNSKYYISFEGSDAKTRSAIISQIRLISIKRLTDKIGFINKEKFNQIKKAIKDLI
jgi:mRNA interferase MazF